MRAFSRKLMSKPFLIQTITLMVMAAALTPVLAQGPLGLLKKNVEADPQKEYRLTEKEGPYLIFAVAFTGQNARKDANTLVNEFRKTYKWNAYIHEMKFEFDPNKDFKKASDPRTGIKATYRNPGGGTEYAVLIGNFPSLEDKQFEKTLDDVRKNLLTAMKNRGLVAPFTMMAFGLANPMLPPEHQQGVVDEFIEKINKDRPYSLLRNPGRYTVQIATFTGRNEFEKSSAILDKLNPVSPKKKTQFEMGEQAAATLCKILREEYRIEAYEFYDRYASIVTVGSFNHHSRQLPNGTIVPDPQVQQVIEQFKGGSATVYQPVVIKGIECDVQPRIIAVPRPRR